MELQAYDLIGKQYYYMGELSLANFYHEKMVLGQFEPMHSPAKDLGITNLLFNKGETDSNSN